MGIRDHPVSRHSRRFKTLLPPPNPGIPPEILELQADSPSSCRINPIISNMIRPTPNQIQQNVIPERLLLCEKFLPLLVDLPLYAQFDFPQLMFVYTRAHANRSNQQSHQEPRNDIANLLFLPAELLLLETHALRRKFLGKDRRVPAKTNFKLSK